MEDNIDSILEVIKNSPELMKKAQEIVDSNESYIPRDKKSYQRRNMTKLRKAIQKYSKNYVAFDLKKSGIKIDRDVEKYVDSKGWTIIGNYLYFEDVKCDKKSRDELLRDYIETRNKYIEAIKRIDCEIKRLNENGE